MKIAIFTDTYEPEINGVVTSTSTFAHMLATDGHKVVIFCPRYKESGDVKEKNIRIYRFRSFSFASNKNTRIAVPPLAKIINILRKEKPDLIHIETPMSLGIIGLVAAKMLDIKNVQTYHTYLPDFSTYFSPAKLFGIEKIKTKVAESPIAKNTKGYGFYQRVRELNRKTEKELLGLIPNLKLPKVNLSARSAWSFTRTLYNRADLVLTPSNTLARILVKHGIKPPVMAQTNGIQSKSIVVKKSYKKSGKIIHFGRLGLEKDIDVVIRAFELALQKDKSLTLHIIGDGPARASLENLVARRVLTDKVKFYGFMPHEEVMKILWKFDLFVTASPMETQGLVVLEAMAAGLPVVGVDMLAVPEVVLDSKNGYVVPRRNYKKMAEKILEITGDVIEQKEMGQKSIEIASKHEIGYAYQLLLEKYRALLDS